MSAPDRIRLGTRGSRLALWQAHHVRDRLQTLPDGPAVEIVEITTTGDRVQDVPLSTLSGQAFFTKEIEQALLEERIDLAVHSQKDLATQLPEGLILAAVPQREDPRDALLSRNGAGLDGLPAGARVGTSSLRRRALLKHLRPDLELLELRGNVPTRLQRLEQGDFEAILLAAAGLRRLELDGAVSELLDPERFVPAVAQGALALQTRESDAATRRWVERLDHLPTRQATVAERALLRRVEGGCQAPVGALARVDGEHLTLHAAVASLDGSRLVEGRIEGRSGDAAAVGIALAERLLAEGADAILEEIRAAVGGASR